MDAELVDILFSSRLPSGMVILLPSVATTERDHVGSATSSCFYTVNEAPDSLMMTVPAKVQFLPICTSPCDRHHVSADWQAKAMTRRCTHVDGQMVELDNVETSLDTTLKVRDLLELVACGVEKRQCEILPVSELDVTDRA